MMNLSLLYRLLGFTLGQEADNGEALTTTSRQELAVSPVGGGDMGSSLGEDVNLYLQET